MDLSFYWRIFLRRIPYLIIFAALGIAIGVSIAISLPARYGARAVMIVESEQIPDELAASTVQTNAIEALQIIRQRILSREVLLDRVWGYGYFGDGRLVDVHIRRLRTKIEADPANPRHVITVRGLGYKIVG